jgi:hypothetical protein
MTRFSSMQLLAGPKSLAPWGDNLWRISYTSQYVTGGGGDYWIPTPTRPLLHEVRGLEILVEDPSLDSLTQSVIYQLALYLGGDAIEGLLLDTHNIQIHAGKREAVPYYEIDNRNLDLLAGSLSESIRLALTFLGENSKSEAQLVSRLRALGFEVTVFRESN